VLVADDNQQSASAFAELLRACDYDVVLAHDGEEACRITVTALPDVLLMDLDMPGMDGLEATRRIRAHGDPDIVQTPIIALTGYDVPEEAQLCYEAGANLFLGKPVGLVQLKDSVQALLGTRG
jgi:CheY-like chemotaxis protein